MTASDRRRYDQKALDARHDNHPAAGAAALARVHARLARSSVPETAS